MRPPVPPGIRRAALRAAALVLLLVPAASISAAPAEPPEGGTVVDVVDGDTLRVDPGSGPVTVRLIGIDAPEKAHPSKFPQFLSAESARFLASLCLGRRVLLVRDREDADRHGRRLRYVHLPGAAAPGTPGALLNLEMVRGGYARVLTGFPFSRRDEFLRAESLAREKGRGIWGEGGLAEARWMRDGGTPGVRVYRDAGGLYVVVFGDMAKPMVPGSRLPSTIETILRLRAENSDAGFAAEAREAGFFPLGPPRPQEAPKGPDAPSAGPGAEGVVSWEDAGRHAGNVVTVEGRVKGTHRGKSAFYLNFHPNWKRYLTVVIPARALAAFPPDPAAFYGGRRIRVRGKVSFGRDRPEMVVTDPGAIAVLEDAPGG